MCSGAGLPFDWRVAITVSSGLIVVLCVHDWSWMLVFKSRSAFGCTQKSWTPKRRLTNLVHPDLISIPRTKQQTWKKETEMQQYKMSCGEDETKYVRDFRRFHHVRRLSTAALRVWFQLIIPFSHPNWHTCWPLVAALSHYILGV